MNLISHHMPVAYQGPRLGMFSDTQLADMHDGPRAA